MLRPAVLAEKDAETILPVPHGQGHWLERFGSLQALFLQDRRRRCKIAGIVEFPVRRERTFNPKIPFGQARQKPAVLRDKGRVVFTHMAVRIGPPFFHGDIAENDRNTLGSRKDFLPVVDAIVQKGRLFPPVSDHVPRNGHFREQDHIDPFLFGAGNPIQHFSAVHVGPAWQDFDLRAG